VIPSLYQQYEPDWKFRVKGKVQANKYTIQLRENSLYGISFYARCEVGSARLQIQLGHAPDNDPVIWTSEEITIDSTLKKYELEYEHAASSVDFLVAQQAYLKASWSITQVPTQGDRWAVPFILKSSHH
jgi:hypothetical protein